MTKRQPVFGVSANGKIVHVMNPERPLLEGKALCGANVTPWAAGGGELDGVQLPETPLPDERCKRCDQLEKKK